MIKPQELPSKRSFAGMPSEELVVIQVIRWNHQHQYGGGKPLRIQRRAKTLSSPSKIAALPISKILGIDVKNFDNKGSVTLAESQVQESKVYWFGTLDTHDKPGEFADEADRSFLNEVNAVITAESNKGDARSCNTCSTSGASANNSTTGQKIGSGTTNDSVEDGKECNDFSTLNALSNEEHFRHRSNTGSTSKSDALSTDENIAHQNEDDATANTKEGKGPSDGHDSASDALSYKENVVAQDIDENVTGNHSQGKGDGFCDHPASDALCDIGDITRPVDIADRAGKSAGKLKDWNHHSTSDLSFDTEDVHQVQDGGTTGNGEGDRTEWTESSNFDATSETSSAHESDGGVPLGNFEKGWAYGSVRSTPQRFSNQDTDQEGDDGDAFETLKKERKDRAEISTSDCLTIDESILSSDPRSGSSVDEGPWVMGVDHHGDIEAHRVSPVAFNVRHLRGSDSTPSIQSGGSELDKTSPLYHKPSAPIARPACPEHPHPPSSEGAGGLKKTTTSLNVWRDDSNEASSGGKPMLRRKPGMIFKDVSNTRQVFCNAQQTRVDQVLGSENKGIGPTRNDPQHTRYPRSSAPYLPPLLTSPITETRQIKNDASESIWKPARDLERAAHIAATLAALEGRLPPTPDTSEGIIRCARQEYGPDVLVEYSAPPLFHPKPIRPWLGEHTVANWEKQAASANGMCSSAPMGRQTGPPSEPTPRSVQPKTMRLLNSERIIESCERQAASANGMCSSTEMRPQIARPSNPTPYAARYYYSHRC